MVDEQRFRLQNRIGTEKTLKIPLLQPIRLQLATPKRHGGQYNTIISRRLRASH